MLPRTLEPEVMDTREEAVDYNSMDHAAVNRCFVDDLLAFLNSTAIGTAIDMGTGTGLIPMELFARPTVDGRCVAVDLSREMLKLGQDNIQSAGLQSRIEFLFADCKQLPVDDNAFDGCMSNSIIHHIPEPLDCLREMVRVTRPGGWLFVRDLMRPSTASTVDELVAQYAGEENEHSRRMFRESLHAALTVDEVRALLSAVDLPTSAVSATSDRHWTIAIR